MRGKRAKKLRKLAQEVLTQVMGDKMSDGYNEYMQARNCTSWVPAYDKDGMLMLHPDGTPMIQLSHKEPGTVTCGWKFRVLYNNMKGRVKHGRRFSTVGSFNNFTRREERIMADNHRARRLKAGSSSDKGRPDGDGGLGTGSGAAG